MSIHTCSGGLAQFRMYPSEPGRMDDSHWLLMRQTGTLSACDWLTPVTRGAWRLSPPADAGGGGAGAG